MEQRNEVVNHPKLYIYFVEHNLHYTHKYFKVEVKKILEFTMNYNSFLQFGFPNGYDVYPMDTIQVRFLPSSGLQKSMSLLGYPNHDIQITSN
jgi:hypothetical protein